MKRTTRIILIIICTLLIILSAVGIIWAFVNKFSNKAYAEELEQTTFVNFNQMFDYNSVINNDNYSRVNNNFKVLTSSNFEINLGISADFITGHKYFINVDSSGSNLGVEIYRSGVTSVSFYSTSIYNSTVTNNLNFYLRSLNNNLNATVSIYVIDLTQMFGSETADSMTVEQCQQLFLADFYPYNTGTAIDLSGFEQYNAGAMSIRESMTINTTSANIAENLDNVVINSSYGSTSKALIQGFMVWNTEDNYTNCTAIFNLQTNFNEGDYFEFEFYTITGADTLDLPNQSFTMDLQIIAVDSSGNIVPLTTIKAQNNTTTPTKATFYLPFDTDKLYITTPHKYIVGYNNFNINITTTNLTALSLYSYQDGYRSGRSSGYTAGYNKGISETNATLGTMEYIGAAFTGIGQILQIELLPGVPFSLFILLPLMFGLIAFVVKLSKGGS